MESVKTLVEAGGGTMDSILQLTVYLANIDYYDGMNQVFKMYFPHGGPARTTVAVESLPGDSLVEINCTAAVVTAAKKERNPWSSTKNGSAARFWAASRTGWRSAQSAKTVR